jgi:hypothetical protein
MKKMFRKYRLESIVLLMVSGVVILRVGNFGIQGFLQRIFIGSIALLQNFFQRTIDWLIAFSRSFTLMDFLSVVLVLGAIGFLFWRIRYHFRRDPDYEAIACPRCGSAIRRVHRTSIDRILGKTFLPNSRRYRCSNKSCGWSGLRHQRYHSDGSVSDREAS